MVELQPYSIGILEQQRVISGRPLILARRANDLHIERLQKRVQFVDVGALAGAEAEMMEADALLLECSASMLRRRRRDGDRGASADAVIGRVGVDDRLQPKKRQQLAIEFARVLEFEAVRKICAMPLISIVSPSAAISDSNALTRSIQEPAGQRAAL